MADPFSPDPLPRLARVEAVGHLAYGVFGAAARFGPLTAVHTGPGVPVNTGWHDGGDPPTETDLAAFEGFCAGHGQPAILHLLSHAAPPLLALLSSRGYGLTGVLHAYTRPLTDLPTPPTLDVREEAGAETWADLASLAFGPGSGAIMGLNARLPGTHRLVARVDGTPAGVAALSVREGVAALYSAATLPEFRGRGVQTALLAARLHLAAELGADLASVVVTPGSGSERNVRRAGFGVAGARLTFTRER
ncbi:GNAT family N-acetyltransferase [Deinococcus sp. YIM 134068]|uniref:GNAT family N-acetyltransferase n=1 Tax=Deinococcus lichenicola TaxID=3118910 RepID=UPI002F95E33C